MSREEADGRIDENQSKSKADDFFARPKKRKSGCSTCGRVTWRPKNN
ncbi:hypothetical protein NIE88_10495 [Sporolactobacillus shoreicorticis]|uniref:Uncharacterized protein n=1 Tax=Sporolactobacillus shoreicorticis TaxID=1923877 RepID=A0ABW5S8G3_9BACL|nr:hypothetical protein [Sporolactobacillus shoreicorticis]MCO7126204.1 hypothetical protein [Sporolactobacillus shoreicorticis]